MGLLVWAMVGIAIWHFMVFLPDRFWGGIAGAFLGALLGAIFSGLIAHGFGVPGNDDLNVLTAIEALPGALIGMAVVWMIGVRQEHAESLHG